ncbi:hypothetical protein JOC78_001117 [Bacillus ectoiniformans]|uniref:hypothetical protein n=1 Tax=Bacillus ectoiniformans TaxID=1494429 RepID=UPI00195C985D|nr:hypothetical protein [Bacillus ectoiniformans]MBM7648175.1 hypothetical protein [Bacillus ectoiniformans]
MKKNHKPNGRLYWERYVELDYYWKNKHTLAINIGADDPMLLERVEALKFASEIAKGKKCNTLLEIEDDIRIYGQNNLAERLFFFKK